VTADGHKGEFLVFRITRTDTPFAVAWQIAAAARSPAGVMQHGDA
jgi:hypothetical protein